MQKIWKDVNPVRRKVRRSLRTRSKRRCAACNDAKTRAIAAAVTLFAAGRPHRAVIWFDLNDETKYKR